MNSENQDFQGTSLQQICLQEMFFQETSWQIQDLNNSNVTNDSSSIWNAIPFGKPDEKSWDAANPMHLTKMYGNPEADLSRWCAGPPVTLPNHLDHAGAFVPFSDIKQLGLAQSKDLHQTVQTAHLKNDVFKNGDEDENLFYSNYTHFEPIDNFVPNSNIEPEQNFEDGHTFDIISALDTIEYERTSSGLLRHGSKEYLKFTNTDDMADEEVANILQNDLFINNKETFIIKFPFIRSGEKACQTEQDFQMATDKEDLFFDNNENCQIKFSKEIACQTEQDDFQLSIETGESYRRLTESSEDNLSVITNGYGCGLGYLCKILFKKITKCCKKERK